MSSSAFSSPDSSQAQPNRSNAPDRGSERWIEAILCGEEEIDDGTPGKSRSQKVYEAMGNSKKVLVTLCVGLFRENGAPLIDLSQTPWSQELKGAMKPANRELANEVCRRQKLFAGTDGTSTRQFLMKPKNKARDILLEWLNKWPIRDEDCRKFLFSEAQRIERLLQAALDEGRENALAMQHGAWTGPLPYLRLIHAITDCNETRMAYLRRHESFDREELDAHNSPIRPKTAFEIIADKWNDPDFHPVTSVSSCHVNFASPIDLCHSKVAALVPADAIGIQNRISSIRVTLLRIIEKWEQSGQGDGGMYDESEEPQQSSNWGTLEGRAQEALDCRENFLGGAPSWYLYFWEMADKFQLLDSTLQRLRDGVGAPDSNAVSVVSRRRRRNEDHGNRSASENGNSSNGNRSGGNGNRAPDDTFGSSMEANMSRLSEILEHLVETSEQDRQVAKKIREDDQLLAKKNLRHSISMRRNNELSNESHNSVIPLTSLKKSFSLPRSRSMQIF